MRRSRDELEHPIPFLRELYSISVVFGIESRIEQYERKQHASIKAHFSSD